MYHIDVDNINQTGCNVAETQIMSLFVVVVLRHFGHRTNRETYGYISMRTRFGRVRSGLVIEPDEVTDQLTEVRDGNASRIWEAVGHLVVELYK
jgi:hypothetical protein